MASSHRSHSSSRNVECSLRVYRQALPACIPENEPLSFGNDEFDDREDISTSNTSDFLFSSPRGRSSNVSQTIKQQPRVYPKTIARLLASSPAHQNQYRRYHGLGPSIPSITSITMASSCSPCLSPIRYTLETSETHPSSTHTDEEISTMPTEDAQSSQFLLPPDNASVKVRRSRQVFNDWYHICVSLVYLPCSELFQQPNSLRCSDEPLGQK